MAIFLILFFLSFFLLVIGLIKPIMVILWGEKRTRGRVLIYYGIATVVFFILFGISSDYKERALKNMSPAQHLNEAQSILYSGKNIEERIKTIDSQKISEARKHLDAIKPEDPEHADAQNMKDWASNLENIQKRRKQIDPQFSKWDGSHMNLTIAIKASMNDPDSYEHIKTTYSVEGDHLVVATIFSGKNTFGGRVKNTVKAKVSLDGTILKIMEQK